jgi:beta-lactamase regulating signal transducer with metallopeptidase domain
MQDLGITQYGLAPALASALLHSLWQVALLAAAAALALRAMARASAAWRHNVAMAFLVAMALVPAVQFLLLWQGPGAQIDNLLPVMTAPGLDAAANALAQDSAPVRAVVLMSWLLGVGLMLARHFGGLRAIAAMERGPFQLLPPRWRQRADEMRRALGIARAVAVRLSDEVLAPCAARLLRPVIWLPLSLLTRMPAEQLEALLAHELAHVARRDWLWNGVQCVIESLLFFHPAMWWLGRRIRQEREHACDDLAVAACGDAIALAEALAALERQRHSSPRLVLAAHGGSLMQRITRLLSGPPSRGRRGALAVLGALTVAGALLIAQIGIAGRLPDLEVESSTAGALAPGDYRQITANGADRLRFYRESIDAQGRRSEVYREDGQIRPIDAGVRRWLADVARQNVPPPPPALPQIEDMAEARSLVALIATHRDVVARVGTPAVATSRAVNGNLRLDGAEGDADIRIELRGPRGQAVAAVEADMHDRIWTLRRVAVE